MSRPGLRGPTSARGACPADLSLFAVLAVLLMVLLVGPADAGDEKTHDRFQPWVLAKMFFLTSTSTGGVAHYDDDQQGYPLKSADHAPG